MLKKLLKYEWKSVSVMLLIVHAVLLVYALIGRIGLGFAADFDELASDSFMFAFSAGTVFYILGYVLALFAAACITFFYLTGRLWKSLFSDEGYLTHTLPVTPARLIWAKILVFLAWTAIDILCLGLSVLILLFSFPETFPSFTELLGSLGSALAGSWGGDVQAVTLLTLLCAVVETIYYIFLLLLAMCIGNQFRTHKILGAVFSAVGLHIAASLINTVLGLWITGGSMLLDTQIFVSEHSDTSVSMSVNPESLSLLGLSALFYGVLCVAYFLLSKYILSKHLNLE